MLWVYCIMLVCDRQGGYLDCPAVTSRILLACCFSPNSMSPNRQLEYGIRMNFTILFVLSSNGLDV